MRVPEARLRNTCVLACLFAADQALGPGATGASVGSATPHARDQKQFVAATLQRRDSTCAAFDLSTAFLTSCLRVSSSTRGN